MKKIFTCIFSSLIACSIFAQQRNIDSLVLQLKSAATDQQRVPILKQLADQQNDIPVILKYAQQGIALTQKLKLPKDQEIFLFALDRGYFKADNYPKMLENCSAALKLSESLNDNFYTVRFLDGIAISYENENEYKKAISYHLTALSIAKKASIASLMVSVCNNTSNAYIDLNLDSAMYYGKMSYLIAAGVHDPNIGYTLGTLGAIENKLHHPQRALSYYYQAIPFFEKSSLFRVKNLASVYGEIAEAYQETGNTDSAFFYSDKAYKLASEGHELADTYQVSKILSTLYEGRDDAQSLKYYKIAAAANDSLNSAEKTRKFELLKFNAQEQETALKTKQEAEQDNLKLLGALLAFAVAFIIAGILWNGNKKQKAANKLLHEQQNQLRATQNQLIQAEKMASLGELTAGIAHEIQNPLNFVNNFSEVNNEMIEELEEELKSGNVDEALAIAADLKGNGKKILHHGKRADFIVKGMLEHSRTGTGEKQLTDLNVLCDEFLKLSYHGLRAKDKNFNAELITHFDANLPKANVSQQDIGRVMLNLFNNAFYAVNQKRKTAGSDYNPEVTATTMLITPPSGGRGAVLTVHDNGDGIPDAIKDKIMQPFFTTKPTGEGTGLGLSLSYDIVVKGHGGAISVETKEGEGSEFTIILPIS